MDEFRQSEEFTEERTDTNETDDRREEIKMKPVL